LINVKVFFFIDLHSNFLFQYCDSDLYYAQKILVDVKGKTHREEREQKRKKEKEGRKEGRKEERNKEERENGKSIFFGLKGKGGGIYGIRERQERAIKFSFCIEESFARGKENNEKGVRR
jgi:hypothetical protein